MCCKLETISVSRLRLIDSDLLSSIVPIIWDNPALNSNTCLFWALSLILWKARSRCWVANANSSFAVVKRISDSWILERISSFFLSNAFSFSAYFPASSSVIALLRIRLISIVLSAAAFLFSTNSTIASISKSSMDEIIAFTLPESSLERSWTGCAPSLNPFGLNFLSKNSINASTVASLTTSLSFRVFFISCRLSFCWT